MEVCLHDMLCKTNQIDKTRLYCHPERGQSNLKFAALRWHFTTSIECFKFCFMIDDDDDDYDDDCLVTDC